MRTKLALCLLATSLLAAPSVVLAGEDGHSRADFIGVFYPAVTVVAVDPTRCPDASYPLLLTFAGEAFTNVGHATFTQSHCQDFAQTSFRRGEKIVTFASGDQLFGVYHGDLLPTPTTGSDGKVVIDAVYRNVGGTGAFSTMHGTGTSAGLVDAASGSAVITEIGTL